MSQIERLFTMTVTLACLGCQPVSHSSSSTGRDALDVEQTRVPRSSILADARTLHVRRLLAEADQSREAGDHDAARSRYEAVLDLSPGQPEAVGGIKRLPGYGSILDDVMVSRTLKAQEALARYEQAMIKADGHLQRGEYLYALDAVSHARSVLTRNRGLIRRTDYVGLVKRVDDKHAGILQAKEAHRLQKSVGVSQNAARIAAESRDRRMLQSHERVRELIARADSLRRRMAYTEAIDILDQVALVDPNNTTAKAMRVSIEDAILFRNARALNRARDVNAATLDMSDGVPTSSTIAYPPDWPQISQDR